MKYEDKIKLRESARTIVKMVSERKNEDAVKIVETLLINLSIEAMKEEREEWIKSISVLGPKTQEKLLIARGLSSHVDDGTWNTTMKIPTQLEMQERRAFQIKMNEALITKTEHNLINGPSGAGKNNELRGLRASMMIIDDPIGNDKVQEMNEILKKARKQVTSQLLLKGENKK